MENSQDHILTQVTGSEYKYGFVTDIETDIIPKGLNEDIVRLISAKISGSRHTGTGQP
jgi:Fe-S cluster assembly protein SufB